MLRQISVLAATGAMLAIGALPAVASPASATASSTHKFTVKAPKGMQAWGSYKRGSSSVKVTICAKDTSSAFAAAAQLVSSTSNNQFHSSIGAVAFGRGQTQCITHTLHFSGHLTVSSFTGSANGRVIARGKTTKLY